LATKMLASTMQISNNKQQPPQTRHQTNHQSSKKTGRCDVTEGWPCPRSNRQTTRTCRTQERRTTPTPNPPTRRQGQNPRHRDDRDTADPQEIRFLRTQQCVQTRPPPPATVFPLQKLQAAPTVLTARQCGPTD